MTFCGTKAEVDAESGLGGVGCGPQKQIFFLHSLRMWLHLSVILNKTVT